MSDSRMFSLPIVIRFDVLKDSMFSDASSHISFAVNEFDFQRVEKTLHRSIVITVGFASHAAAQTVVLDQSLISLGTILAATIRVNDRAPGEVAAEQCHGQRITDQLLRHTPAHRPTHDGAGIQVHDHRQIQPALVGPDVTDIADPFLIRRLSVEVLLEQIRRDRL